MSLPFPASARATREAVPSRPLPVLVHGARGMLAGEFLRLLEGHPFLEARLGLVRDPAAGLPFPHLASPPPLAAEAAGLTLLEKILAAEGEAVLVLALPHGEAAPALERLEKRLGGLPPGLRVLDLSADHRDGSRGFLYALPELQDLLRPELDWTAATRLAAPGCFATAAQLALVPPAAAGLLDPAGEAVMWAVTGSSGAGNRPAAPVHHPFRHANLQAYAAGGHRHEAEIGRALEAAGAGGLAFRLLPHRGPQVRGIHLSLVAPLRAGVAAGELREAWAPLTGAASFLVWCEEPPELRAAAGGNRALLHAQARDGHLQVFLVLDNLLKGGSGQGLQALNRSLGLPEDLGLARSGWGVL